MPDIIIKEESLSKDLLALIANDPEPVEGVLIRYLYMRYKEFEKIDGTTNGKAHKIMTLFNSICKDLTPIKIRSSTRVFAIVRQDKKFNKGKDDLEFWKGFFTKIHESDFLSGRKTEWKANFDWSIKPANMVKILEGNYDNKKHTLWQSFQQET